MPTSRTIHLNPVNTKNKTRCGRTLGRYVSWRTDIADVTCNNCIKLDGRDKQKSG
jgi:hypothetical protein